jgi:hypothetical protein
MRKYFGAFFLLALCFVPLSRHGSAATQTTQTERGITLSPAIVQASVSSTEAEHQLTFKVTNNTDVVQNLDISTADFNTLDETGGLVFVGANPTELQKKYGLATWLRLPQTNLTLQPKQMADISAVVTNQSSLAPGGHYGALMLAQRDAGSQGSSNNKVAVHPIATSLLFVSKIGGDTHKLQLTDVETPHNIIKLPSVVTLRFHNNGNTHLTPRGEVTVTDPKGKLISKGIINDNSGIILPETYRRYSVSLRKLSTPIIPGNYNIAVKFHFDGYEKIRSYKSRVLFLTPILIIAAVATIAVIISTVILFKSKYLAKFFTTGRSKYKK